MTCVLRLIPRSLVFPPMVGTEISLHVVGSERDEA
jgi:hypothetical protein